MKLTVSITADKHTPPREVEYDRKPALRFIPTNEYKYHGRAKFGVHVVWCYYGGGKRVATVVVNPSSSVIGRRRLSLRYPCA